jgi:hypothetical protein
MTRREKPSWLPRTLVSCLTCGAAGAVADAYDTGGADRGQLTGPEPQEAPTDSSVSRMRHHETLHQDIDLPQEPGRLVSAEGSAEAAAAPAGAAPASAEGLQPAGSSSAVPPYLWEAAALLQPGTAAAVSGVPDEGTTAGPAPAATLEPPTTMQLPPINTKRSPAAHRKQQQQHQASPKPPLPGPSRRGLLLMQSEPVNLLESPTSMSLPNRRLHHLQQQQQQQQEQPSPLQLDFSFPSITSMPDPALLQQALRRPASFQSGVDAPGRRTSFSSVTSDTLLEDVPLRLRPIRTPRYTIKVRHHTCCMHAPCGATCCSRPYLDSPCRVWCRVPSPAGIHPWAATLCCMLWSRSGSLGLPVCPRAWDPQHTHHTTWCGPCQVYTSC